MGSKQDYLENKVLDHVLRNTTYTQAATVYSALFTTIPSDATGGTEVTVVGYARVATSFGTAASGSASNTNVVTFATAATAYTVVGWALCETSTLNSTNTILYWATVTTLAIGVGDQATFAAAGIVITED